MHLHEWAALALAEDTGAGGDHTTRATIGIGQTGNAKLIIKNEGIWSGTDYAAAIFACADPNLEITWHKQDGDVIERNELAFEVSGAVTSILTAERTVLNILQRLCGIATHTQSLCALVRHTNCILLDTRKTTPFLREAEKAAVRAGGGQNHRMRLDDMILIKDNHVDAAGGVREVLERAKAYQEKRGLSLPVVLEVRNRAEIAEALETGGADRLLLDNFSPDGLAKEIMFIAERIPTEASGNITRENLKEYAETGVDFISMGSLTYGAKPLDLSLKLVR